MTTAIDTNVLVALWAGTPTIAAAVQQSLLRASERGPLLVAAPVYAELIAAPQWTGARIDQLLATMQVGVDWSIDEAMWRMAGAAYRDYADRRARNGVILAPGAFWPILSLVPMPHSWEPRC